MKSRWTFGPVAEELFEITCFLYQPSLCSPGGQYRPLEGAALDEWVPDSHVGDLDGAAFLLLAVANAALMNVGFGGENQWKE